MPNGFFSEEKLSEIRDRSSILEIVSDYVSLKKTGKNYKGLCPFHSEKTPSFMVNEEKQIFHCFGCGEGGDVFAFLMKVENLSFPQAAEELARRYGVKLPSRELSLSQKKEMTKKEILFQINEIASEYFYGLLTLRREGEEGRRYLSRRGISKEIIEEHRLGYSLERWNGLVQHFQERKVSLEMARELGLIFPQKKVGDSTLREGWYDSFRGRILFPIFDLHQRVVGFGGRLIKEGQPKYINSSESSLYHKGEVLYGLHVAKRYIPEKECVIIAEGYFDLLTLHQYGLKHSVATLGTALTAQHIRALKRYTNSIITMFDADPAGIQATLRSLPLFLEEGVVGKTVILPKGEDPDGFLRKGDLEDLEKRIAGSVPLIDFFLDGLMSTYDVKSIDGRIKVAEEGVALVGKISEKIRRDFYLKTLAERLDLEESLLHEMLPSSPAVVGSSRHSRRKAPADLRERLVEESFPKSEETVIRLMVHRPGLIPVISEERILREFESPVLQKLGEELETLYLKKGRIEVAETLGFLEGDLQRRLCEFVFQGSSLEGDLHEKILRDCIDKIRKRRLKKDERELLKRIQEAEKQGGGDGLEALLTERQELARREKGLWKNGLRRE